MRIAIFLAVCVLLAQQISADILFKEYNDPSLSPEQNPDKIPAYDVYQDPETGETYLYPSDPNMQERYVDYSNDYYGGDEYADSNGPPSPASEEPEELSTLVKDMRKLVEAAKERYSDKKADINEDFMKTLASYSTCGAKGEKPVPAPESADPYEPNPAMEQFKPLRHIFRMIMPMVKNFTKSRLFLNVVKGVLKFGLSVASFAASILAKIPECVSSPMCTLVTNAVESSAKQFATSENFDFYANVITDGTNSLVQVIPGAD